MGPFSDLSAEGFRGVTVALVTILQLFFINFLTIHLLISLGTLLARKNIEGTVWSFSNFRHADVVRWPLDEFIVCLKLPCIKYAYNDLISDFSIFGIQIGIFEGMIFKLITSEATCKFWNLHFLFFIINILVWTQRVKPGFMHALGNPSLYITLSEGANRRAANRVSWIPRSGWIPGARCLDFSVAPVLVVWTP